MYTTIITKYASSNKSYDKYSFVWAEVQRPHHENTPI